MLGGIVTVRPRPPGGPHVARCNRRLLDADAYVACCANGCGSGPCTWPQCGAGVRPVCPLPRGTCCQRGLHMAMPGAAPGALGCWRARPARQLPPPRDRWLSCYRRKRPCLCIAGAAAAAAQFCAPCQRGMSLQLARSRASRTPAPHPALCQLPWTQPPSARLLVQAVAARPASRLACRRGSHGCAGTGPAPKAGEAWAAGAVAQALAGRGRQDRGWPRACW